MTLGAFGFLISCYRIFAFGNNAPNLQHFSEGFHPPGIAAWMHLQLWLTPRSSSWLATSTLCPNRGASNACPRDIQFASPATILKAVTGTWSLRLRWCGQEVPEISAKIPADREAPIYGK